jgi:hypothetical protein
MPLEMPPQMPLEMPHRIPQRMLWQMPPLLSPLSLRMQASKMTTHEHTNPHRGTSPHPGTFRSFDAKFKIGPKTNYELAPIVQGNQMSV